MLGSQNHTVCSQSVLEHGLVLHISAQYVEKYMLHLQMSTIYTIKRTFWKMRQENTTTLAYSVCYTIFSSSTTLKKNIYLLHITSENKSLQTQKSLSWGNPAILKDPFHIWKFLRNIYLTVDKLLCIIYSQQHKWQK